MSLQLLQADAGGRPLANDDLLVLQGQTLALGLPALLSAVKPCVVSGCRVWQTGTVWNVGPGLVWDGVNLLPYAGQSNVTLPAMFAPGAVQVVDERAYQTGGTKTTIKGQSMELVPVVSGAPNLLCDTFGALTFWHRLQEQTRSKKLVEWVASATPANYGADGVGLPGTEAWGWALCDGQDGRVDLLGRTAVDMDPTRADYDTIGKQGGQETVQLTIAQMPRHSHGTNANGRTNTIQYKSGDTGGSPQPAAATVDYTGGDQPHENRMPYTTLLARQWVGFGI